MSWMAAHPFLTVAVVIYALVALGCVFASLAEMAGRGPLRAGPVAMAGSAAMLWPVTLVVLSAWSTSTSGRRGGARVSPGRLRPSA